MKIMLFDIQRFVDTRWGTSGNDTIINYDSNVIIYGLEGDDELDSHVGSNVTINGGDGNDGILNYSHNTEINGGDGNDVIVDNIGSNVTINGGAGADSILNTVSSNVVIYGNDDDDKIDNYGDSVTIDGGAGDDAIYNGDKGISISGDEGIYYIGSRGSNVSISGGAGFDSIENYGSNVSISGGAGSDSIGNNGNNVSISGNDDVDVIENHGDSVTINGGAGNDFILNTIGSNVVIYGGDDEDTIWNYSDSVTIDGGSDDDVIFNYGGNVTIDGGAGDDSIGNTGSNVSISGGAGDDIIINLLINDNATIDGGAGNDYISINSISYYNVIRYTNGSDNDTVYGFDSNDTLKISSNSYSTTTSGDDILVNVDSGSILLVGAASISPNIEQPNDYTLFLESNQTENIWLSGWDYFNNANVWGNDTLSNIDSSNNGYAHILAGNNLSNQIVAGSGSTSMWGGNGGNDTMIGGSSRDYFVYINGNGNDFAKNFKAGSSGDSDIVALQGNLGTIEREGNTVTVNGASGGSLIVETDFSTDEAILYTIDGTNIGAAKLADSTNTLYYDKNVYHFRFNDNAGRLFYWGNEDVTIALDNSTAQDYVGLKTIITKSDTEKASGNLTLIGNDLDNEIYSGAGNDMLTGGSGADTFYWGSGDGYDIITDAESSDIINLYNVSLSDISSTSVSDNKLDLRLNDGSHLDAYYGTQATFQLADDTRWKYQDGDWQQQA